MYERHEDRALVGDRRVQVVLLARLVDRDAFEHDPLAGAARGVRHLSPSQTSQTCILQRVYSEYTASIYIHMYVDRLSDGVHVCAGSRRQFVAPSHALVSSHALAVTVQLRTSQQSRTSSYCTVTGP